MAAEPQPDQSNRIRALGELVRAAQPQYNMIQGMHETTIIVDLPADITERTMRGVLALCRRSGVVRIVRLDIFYSVHDWTKPGSYFRGSLHLVVVVGLSVGYPPTKVAPAHTSLRQFVRALACAG